jgi:hypothetical protein
MSILFLLGTVFALYPHPIASLSSYLGVGRPVDLLIYGVSVMLVRELFISRARDSQQKAISTALIRTIAHENARIIAISNQKDL